MSTSSSYNKIEKEEHFDIACSNNDKIEKIIVTYKNDGKVIKEDFNIVQSNGDKIEEIIITK